MTTGGVVGHGGDDDADFAVTMMLMMMMRTRTEMMVGWANETLNHTSISEQPTRR